MTDRTILNKPVPIERELKTLFRHNEPLIIFEIGACEGEDSIKYSRLFSNAKIYAFEPLPENIKLIQKNLLNYGITNVTFYNKALLPLMEPRNFMYRKEGLKLQLSLTGTMVISRARCYPRPNTWRS